MPELLSPGVYPTEVDYSAYVKSISTSTLGLVGVFEKGPVGEPTLVTSLEQARSLFGTYLDAAGYYGMLALKSFFENGGARAYVVRTVHYSGGAKTSTPATVTLVDRAGSPLSTLRVDASSDGTWAATHVSVEVQASVGYSASGFNLLVKFDGAVVETFKDLLIGSANIASSDYIEKRVNGISAYIRVADLLSASADPSNRPALASADLAGGDTGLSALGVTDFVGDVSIGSGLYGLDTVAINMVTVPGEFDSATGPTLASAVITYCEGRKDCIGIIETPPSDNTSQKMVDFRSGTGTYVHTAFDSSYAALYGPWVSITHPITGATTSIPPSGYVAGVYARNDAVADVWDAPAGVQRGLILNALKPSVRLSKGDCDVLYPAGVNPLTIAPTGAFAVYGQKTLQLRASATDRVNVRRLMAYIEKSVTDSAQYFVFEANNKTTWEAYKRLINPFLQRIKDDGGLSDFLVICDETLNTGAVIDTNTMKARILVKPTRTAEFLPIEFAIAPTGANFADL